MGDTLRATLTMQEITVDLDDEAKSMIDFVQELQGNDITVSQIVAHFNNLNKLERQLINTLYFCGRMTGNKWKVTNLNK